MDETKHSASLALAAYAENFLGGRRVVVFGDACSGFAELLVERGARLVHVYDADTSRVARAIAVSASPNISFAPLTPAGLPVRDGAFDVGFVSNLATHSNPSELVNRLRRALSARGIGFLAVPNREQAPVFDREPDGNPLSYYELYDLASAEFDEVRTLGQTPFVGYALADFGPDRDETFTIDTALVPGGAEEPEWFIAVVSHFPINCEPFSVIQFPAAQVLDRLPATEGDNRESMLGELLLGAQQQASEAEHKLAALERQLQAVQAPAPQDGSRELLVQARLELEKRDAWVSELEARRTAAEAQTAQARDENQRLEAKLKDAAERAREAASAQAELARLKQELSTAQAAVRAAAERERALSENQAETAKLLAIAEQRQGQVDELQKTLTEARSAAASAIRATDEQSQENQGLEQLLRERAQVIQQLERDVRKSDLFGAQLLRELEDAQEQLSNASGPVSVTIHANDPATSESQPSNRELELESQVSRLAAVDAQRIADLTAAQWTIGELETRLLESEPSSNLATELKQAQAQLQRQATLLAQLQASTQDLDG